MEVIMMLNDNQNPKSIVRLFARGLALAILLAVPVRAEAPSPSVDVMDGKLGDADPTPEISTAELRAALASGNTVVLDARPKEEYAVSHIPGARGVAGKPGLPPSLYTADVGDVVRMVPDRSTALVVYCNGLHCGRSKRFGADLTAAGYTSVRRYQLGIPAWRGLGGVTQVEKAALHDLLRLDRTAVLVDARPSGAAGPRLRGAKSIPLSETTAAKDDGRLPMTDHNTRILVVGDSAEQARAVAEAIVKDAFHNVSFYAGTVRDLQ
jgi:rhodanese-related sulfurtransferase